MHYLGDQSFELTKYKKSKKKSKYLGDQSLELKKDQYTNKSKFKIPGWVSRRTSETLDLRARLQLVTCSKFWILFIFRGWTDFLVFSVEIYLLLWQWAGASWWKQQLLPSTATNALSFTLFPSLLSFSCSFLPFYICFFPLFANFFDKRISKEVKGIYLFCPFFWHCFLIYLWNKFFPIYSCM